MKLDHEKSPLDGGDSCKGTSLSKRVPGDFCENFKIGGGALAF
jgi:hypothetical protein